MISPGSRGGMFSVVKNYQNVGFFDNWKIVFLKTHDNFSFVGRMAIASVALLKFLRMIVLSQINFIHVHLASKGSFYRKSIFIMIGRLFRLPVIIHLHGSEFKIFYDNHSKLQKQFINYIFNLSDSIIVLSKEWEKFIKDRMILRTPISIINNFVKSDFDSSGPVKKVKNSIVFLGELGRRKGISDLLTVVKRLTKKYPDILLFCGGNGDLEKINREVDKLGIKENVNILGWVDQDKKKGILKKGQIFVLPSYNEGQPMAIIEAMSFGLPIISTMVGGIPDTIKHGKEGYLIEPGDLEALEIFINRLFEDSKLRDTLSKNAREKYTHLFSPKVVLKQINCIYRRLDTTSNRQ